METLVAAAILVILLALLIPNLRLVRKQSDSTINLSRMRQTMIDFAAWSNDHNGIMVNAGLPEAGGAEWFYGAGQSTYMARSMYPSQMFAWPRVLYKWSGESSEAWHATSGPRPLSVDPDQQLPAYSDRTLWHTLPSRFVYSETLLTSSAVWQRWTQALSPDEYALSYREVKFSDIVAPSIKGVLLFRIDQESSSQWTAAFADGHVASHKPEEFREAVPHPTSIFRIRGAPVLHTTEGSAGSDL